MNSDFRALIGSNCNCITGYYDDGLKSICAICSAICESCIGSPDFCITCNSNDFRSLNGNTCVCALGYYDIGE